MTSMTPRHACRQLGGLAAIVAAAGAFASSHREAPFVTEMPKVDGTDFYMFNSYENGREGFVTIVANFVPLQDPYGGPNYFSMDPEALYQIHIDNDGDAREDVTFEFRFTNSLRAVALDIGGVMVPVPLINVGEIGPEAGDDSNLNIIERFRVNVVTGDQYDGDRQPITNVSNGSSTFRKPVDNIGMKSIPDYAAYAADHVYEIALPGSSTRGRMFVGQRKDPFVVNLGETFDLVNLNPLGAEDSETDDLADKNVTSLILEIPVSYLTNGKEPVLGGWSTASLRRGRVLNMDPSFGKPATETGSWVQVSRLGSPLVNEVVIGVPDKNRFNNSRPSDDGQFLTYVTNPTLPALLNALFGVTAPCLPRNDLVAVYLTGVEGLTQPDNVVPGEMLRLNTAIPPTPSGMQSRLGVLGMDLAGFPNGRRPGDDVVDISLRAVMGVLSPDAGEPNGCAPSGDLPYTDGAIIDSSFFNAEFPYLLDPLPGSPSN